MLGIKSDPGRRLLFWTIVALIIIDLIFIGLSYWGGPTFKWDGKIGITELIGIPALILTLVQLSRAIRLQRANFIRDYVAKVFTDAELSGTFYDLIYSYNEESFAKLDQSAKEKFGDEIDKLATTQVVNGQKKPIFIDIFNSRTAQEPGKRLWHPALFQGSIEEKRLDIFLNYLNVVGYYYHNGFLKMSDIAGSIGSHLWMIRKRSATSRYMDLLKNRWNDHDKEFTLGVPAPLSYLHKMLSEFEDYAKLNSERINKELQRIP